MTGKFVFINMPTKNVANAREFYTKLGFDINKEYSNDENVFIVIAQNTYLVLVGESLLRQLGENRELADPRKVTEAFVAISVDSREGVDKLVEAALTAGAQQAGEAMEEEEIGLYSRAFYDLDGHKIDINHMSA